MTKLRIVITINYLAVGGSQSFALALAQGLAERGHTVFVYDFNLPYFTNSLVQLNSPLLQSNSFSLIQYKIPLPAFLYDQLIRVRFLEPIITWIMNIFRIKQFNKFVVNNKINIVSSHLMAADTLSSCAVNNLSSVAHSITMHGSYEGFPKAAYKKKRERTFSRVNGIIYLSLKNIQFLKRLKYKNARVKIQQIYNGYIPQIFQQEITLVTRKELNIPEDSFVFIQVARGTQDKGWQEAINAFLIAKQQTKKKMILLLVGDGEYLSGLKRKYSNHPEIVFYGYSGNPIPLIQLSDVGLLPTYYKGESLPNTIIEYLFSGKPVLASNIGEINSMIGIDSNNAAGNTFNLSANGTINEAELSDKMMEYVSDLNLYGQHAANTAIQCEKFKMHNCLSAYEQFFASLIKGD